MPKIQTLVYGIFKKLMAAPVIIKVAIIHNEYNINFLNIYLLKLVQKDNFLQKFSFHILDALTYL